MSPALLRPQDQGTQTGSMTVSRIQCRSFWAAARISKPSGRTFAVAPARGQPGPGTEARCKGVLRRIRRIRSSAERREGLPCQQRTIRLHLCELTADPGLGGPEALEGGATVPEGPFEFRGQVSFDAAPPSWMEYFSDHVPPLYEC